MVLLFWFFFISAWKINPIAFRCEKYYELHSTYMNNLISFLWGLTWPDFTDISVIENNFIFILSPELNVYIQVIRVFTHGWNMTMVEIYSSPVNLTAFEWKQLNHFHHNSICTQTVFFHGMNCTLWNHYWLVWPRAWSKGIRINSQLSLRLESMASHFSIKNNSERFAGCLAFQWRKITFLKDK